ncbi:uncharacterized protein LOC8057448 isoform X2 [Sorghum bicolor]|uniref:uncharacterized protein LOC8057448 isoform X2 n=1 Tax=Sorghum bicolor TaxID=4558 RepID=UPI000B4239A6|nr:uncharacterized protein LOC8057448 isoform X2 [Sorghum bicolor]|eukprot:XP_021318100.1 uncharacterized protein LOC8057448 isoform X2 [Sorghum bicolor]
MEALLELEKVQRVLSLMSSRGLSHADSSGGGAAADRFLAQFLLFMVQPFDSLTMENKFLLVSELLAKATPDTLEEMQHLTHLEANQDIPSGGLLQPIKKSKMHAENSTIQAVPMVGFDAMTRAKSTLEDFCRSYFMFHGLDVNEPQAIFKYLPVLCFTESYIYQLDASNEDCLHVVPNDNTSKVLGKKEEALIETSLSQMIEPLEGLLQCQGLMTDRLGTELKSGIQYWSLERKLCQALLRNEKVNELHMDFLSVSEFLVEISDDLYDYEDDVMNNTFNILRMFAAIYGPLEAPNMLAKCIGEAEEKYESFSKKLEPSLSGSYWRRCEEATKEGGKISGHAYGTWNIPRVISNEDSFRRERLSKHDASAVII